MPAWTAWTMLRKRGFSSLRRSIRPIWRVKVEASQSRTSDGTDSDWMSLSSSSVSTKRLKGRGGEKQMRWREQSRQMCRERLTKCCFPQRIKTQSCPSINNTSYVTSNHPRLLKTPPCSVQIQLPDVILHSYLVVLTCPEDQAPSTRRSPLSELNTRSSWSNTTWSLCTILHSGMVIPLSALIWSGSRWQEPYIIP